MADLAATIRQHRAVPAREVAATVLGQSADACAWLVQRWSTQGRLALDRRSFGRRGKPPLAVAGMGDVDAIVQLCSTAQKCPAGAVAAFNRDVRPLLEAAFEGKAAVWKDAVVQRA